MLAVNGLPSLAIVAATILLLARLAIGWFALLDAPEGTVGKFSAGVRWATDPVLVPMRRLLPPLRLGGVHLDRSILALFAIILMLRSSHGL
jgi:YggT family protein